MRARAVVIGLAMGIAVGIFAVAAGEAATAAHSAATAAHPAATPAHPAATPAHPAATPARLFVNAKEWSLILSRQSLKPGTARIQLYNAGEDAHDLRLRRVGGTRTLKVAETTPGDVTELRAMLRPGKWKLWCSLPGHARAGMRATLVVRR